MIALPIAVLIQAGVFAVPAFVFLMMRLAVADRPGYRRQDGDDKRIARYGLIALVFLLLAILTGNIALWTAVFS